MNPLQKYNPNAVAAAEAPASWEQVKYWADVAGKFQQASLAAQVMAGFALAELKKNLGIKHGTRTDLADNLPHDAGSATWPELCQQQAGISDDTARRWILMAEGIKSRWKKLSPEARLRALMSVPVADWTVEDTKVVSDALYKVTDGATQLEFMRELGLAKAKAGNPNASGKGKRQLTLGEQAAAEHLQVAEVMNRILVDLETLGSRFTVCTDMDCEIFNGALTKTARAVASWLAQPKNARQPAVIAQTFARK